MFIIWQLCHGLYFFCQSNLPCHQKTSIESKVYQNNSVFQRHILYMICINRSYFNVTSPHRSLNCCVSPQQIVYWPRSYNSVSIVSVYWPDWSVQARMAYSFGRYTILAWTFKSVNLQIARKAMHVLFVTAVFAKHWFKYLMLN